MRETPAREALRSMGLLREADGRQWLELRTSGTTDSPRTVVRSLASWEDSFDHVTRLTGITAGDRVLVPAPPGGSMFAFALAHAAHLGADVVALPRWSMREAELALAECTVAHLTPSMLTALLERDLGRLRTVVCAGSGLPAVDRGRAEGAGLGLVDYYGAAELSFVAVRTDGVLAPFPEVEVDVRDGVIWARSPWLCEGYADGRTGPLERDDEGWATVGDRGRLDDDGGLVVVGRDDSVTTGGATVVCADVEAQVRSCAGVTDAVVIGTPHPDLGELLEVVVVAPDPVDLTVVRADVAARLSPSHLPRRWHHWPELPLTPAGKVDRREVRCRLVEARAGAETTP
ncbi:class I adenylate-forming enzyme family protein [Knoellia sp. CPCC 206435]|uniref:class I adenylate-forming enzyme family protein n=1 Tax=Knoellia terrae TaxID=3404797 RepID=UPI003B42986B